MSALDGELLDRAEWALAPAMPPADGVLLSELLGHRGFGLELVAGDVGAGGRRVHGAHAVEVERPTRWLADGWIMLTTGLRLRDDDEAQRRLVAELADHGIAALGFGLGCGFDEVPESVVDEAGRRGFPVFSIPYRTLFRDLEDFVKRASFNTELRITQRVMAVQRYLFDAVQAGNPAEELVGRLAALTRASVSILDEHGRCQFSTATPPGPHVWAEIDRRPTTVLEFDADETRCIAVPIAGWGTEGRRWLVVTGAGQAFADPVTKRAAEAAAPLLTAISRLDELRRRQDRATRAGILDALLGETGAAEAATATRCAAAVGVDVRGSYVIVAESTHGCEDVLEEHLDVALQSSALPGLVTIHEGRVTALLSASDGAPTERLRTLIAEDRTLRIGVGGAVVGSHGVQRSWREALLAFERAASHGPHRLVHCTELDLTGVMLAGEHRELIVERSNDLLRPIEEQGLLRTLVTYFACDLNVGRAAHALGVHPNTIRNRLQRVEELLQSSLQRPATVAALHVALLSSSDLER